ncbi:MAG: DNA internalization-related competence protein ComEC/Rec2 [Bacillota bacterium]
MRRYVHLFDFRGQWHHLIITLSFWLLHYEDTLFIIFFILYIIYLFTLSKQLAFVVFCVIACYAFIRASVPSPSIPSTLEATVLESTRDAKKAIIKTTSTKLILYDEDLPHMTPGTTLYIEGTFKPIDPPTMPGEFNYARYLISQNIAGYFYPDEIQVTGDTWHLYKLKYHTKTYINSHFEITAPYMRAFILGDKTTINQEVNNATSSLGIAHLFAISGLHVSLLTVFLVFTLDQLKTPAFFKLIIISMVLFLYMVVTSFTPSIVRASLMMGALLINKYFKLKMTPIDILTLLAIAMMLINPFIYYHQGFILTFLVTTILFLSQPIIKNKSRLSQSLYVSIFAFISTIPIIAQFNQSIHPFTIIFNIIYVAYTSVVVLPLTYVTFIFPFIEPLYNSSLILFEGTVIILNSLIPSLPIVFNSKSLMLIYYVLFFYMMHTNNDKTLFKRALVFSSCVLCIILLPFLSVTQQVTFFHVNGDAILLQDRFNQCNILIDTGNEDPQNKLITSLKTRRITHLDMVIITHDHRDHNGMLKPLHAAYSIRTIIDTPPPSPYMTCGNFSIQFYTPEHPFKDPNNQSLVFTVTFNNETILFTGDIESPVEQYYLDYPLDVTMLKVAHHGSDTSTSNQFLDHVDPDTAIISAHQNTMFNHPSPSVVNKFKTRDITLYQTKEEGTITFTYIFNKRIKKHLKNP